MTPELPRGVTRAFESNESIDDCLDFFDREPAIIAVQNKFNDFSALSDDWHVIPNGDSTRK